MLTLEDKPKAEVWANINKALNEAIEEAPMYLGIKETSDLFGISKYSIREGIKNNVIEHIVVGNKYYINPVKFKLLLDSGINILGG